MSEWIAEGSVFALAALPLLRLVAARRFRGAFPRLVIVVSAALIAGAATFVLLAAYAPLVLRAAAVGTAIALVLLWWRGRAGYGRSRGLPPGSLALVPVQPWLDPRFYLDRHGRHGPIMKMSHFSHPMICVLGFEEASALLRDHEGTHLRAPDAAFVRYLPCGFLRSMLPADHLKYRRMIRDCVSRVVVIGAGDEVRAILRRGLDRIAAQDAVPGSADRRDALIRDTMLSVLLRLFIGVNDREPDHAALCNAYREIDRGHRRRITLHRAASDRKVFAALDVVKAIWRRRAEGFATSTAAPGCFVEAGARAGADVLRDETLLLNLVFLAQVSTNDLSGLMNWLIKMLSDHPEWRGRLRDAITADSQAAAALADRILRETLRMEQSEHLYRRITQSFRYRGFLFPQGWLLRINVRESHRDPATFAQPDAFDPDRFVGRSYKPTEYAPFGLLKKACLGEQVTRLVGTWFLLELVGGYDWEVENPGEREYEGWHWAPGRDFRVRLARFPFAAIAAESPETLCRAANPG